jgi:hypothetical protein
MGSLSNGTHTFDVFALDKAHNASTTYHDYWTVSA